eukprot:CAMPEP_0117880480 /NCGR_PEP_ID=MMETSP0950-20121206/16194_1 /TAXON_ID=44440 /ORGANISM="Chattonella subsalsa, Strain CCMP2191" /LENGTH=194 /DNA_ID=CAMNT_0005735433 /DNA_START=180 /DNA_END=764 /DNA_ORIENTATION=+
MFIHHSRLHNNQIVEDDEEEGGDDLYQAILENQRQMTRMAAEDAMHKEQINETDFIKFERAVNAKFDKQVEIYQKNRESTVTLSASAFVDLKKAADEHRKSSLSNVSIQESPLITDVNQQTPCDRKLVSPETDTSTEKSTERGAEGNLEDDEDVKQLHKLDSIGAEMDKMLSEIKLPEKTPTSKDRRRKHSRPP